LKIGGVLVFETYTYAAGAGGAAAQPNWMVQFFPLLVLFGIFYFILIRPQQKKQKVLQNMLSSLKVGDKVITNGGVHGEVAFVGDKVLHLKVANNVKLVFSKGAIAGLQNPDENGNQ